VRKLAAAFRAPSKLAHSKAVPRRRRSKAALGIDLDTMFVYCSFPILLPIFLLAKIQVCLQ
jgi:hypothetical protein